MSATLKMRPADRGTTLPDELRYALERAQERIDRIFDESDVPLFRGLKAGGVKGADEVLKAIEKWEHVELFCLY
jgi:hypothetical protein